MASGTTGTTGIGSCDHTVHRHQHQHAWDRATPPVFEIDDGDGVEFDTTDASGGQLHADSTADDLEQKVDDLRSELTVAVPDILERGLQ